MTPITGFVNIIKPTGMTSSDVVLRVKKILKTKKVGHLGTLDPAASGVLPVAVGKATKFFDYFLNKDKTYIAVVKFGVETDSLDSFGNITIKNSKITSATDIEKVLPDFTGRILQVPPKYSAIKINGKRACDLARENIDFEIKPKQITIHSIKLISQLEENVFKFEVHCSAGTYIRTLFSDIAYAVGTVSTTPVIIRTQSGRFNLNNAITLEDFELLQKTLSVTDVFNDLQIADVDEKIAKKLINGVKITQNEANLPKIADFNKEILFAFENNLIGMYRFEEGKFQPIVYLYN